MSLIRNNRVSVRPFYNLPPLANCPEIRRASSLTPSLAGSERSEIDPVARDERCLITQTLLYTHKRAHWVNAVRRNPPLKEEIEDIFFGLSIVDAFFDLDHAPNLSNLDRVVHKSLDAYAVIAVTCTKESLQALIAILEQDNSRRQRIFDEDGVLPARIFDFTCDSFRNPRYELVALHPDHFLPAGSFLTRHDPEQGNYKIYYPSPDRRLREAPGDIGNPTFPSFPGPSRPPAENLNPFMVVINADIKFRRYRRLPTEQPLPSDVHELMDLTKKLVDLIYWQATPTPGSVAENRISATTRPLNRVNPARSGGPTAEQMIESEGESGMSGAEGPAAQPVAIPSYRRARRFPWPAGADLQTRIAMGSALLSGHNLEFTSEDEEVYRSIHGHYDVPDREGYVAAWQNTIVS